MKWIIATVGFVLTMLGLNAALDMINAANTIENIAGLLLFVAVMLIAIKTKFLTDIRINLKKKKEDEENS